VAPDQADVATRLRDAAAHLARASDALTKVAGTSAVELVPEMEDTTGSLDEEELKRALDDYRAARAEYAAALTAAGRSAPAGMSPNIPEQQPPEHDDETSRE
jgi:hypothetical protein